MCRGICLRRLLRRRQSWSPDEILKKRKRTSRRGTHLLRRLSRVRKKCKLKCAHSTHTYEQRIFLVDVSLKNSYANFLATGVMIVIRNEQTKVFAEKRLVRRDECTSISLNGQCYINFISWDTERRGFFWLVWRRTMMINLGGFIDEFTIRTFDFPKHLPFYLLRWRKNERKQYCIP